MINLNIKKSFYSSGDPFLLDLSATIADKEFVTFFGRSGAGKTTVLRILAGLTVPDSGVIEVNGDVWFDSYRGIYKKPQERSIGYVFQEYNLFPNMTVAKNIAYATPKDADHACIAMLIEMAGLSPILDRKPHQLSGGQRQRVALVRALVRKPDVLLLDEPLSALDTDMRSSLQSVIARMHKQYGITTCMVSHDMTEVFRLSDHVYILDRGLVHRHGAPEKIFVQGSDNAQVFGNDIVSIEREGDAVIATIRIGDRFDEQIITAEYVAGTKRSNETE